MITLAAHEVLSIALLVFAAVSAAYLVGEHRGKK